MTEHKNPIDQCASLNPLVLPEYCLHSSPTSSYCVWGSGSLSQSTFLIAYHVYRYLHRPVMSGPGLYDPTTILNMDMIKRCQVEGWVKLVFYVLSFFYFIYGWVSCLSKNSNICTDCVCLG